MQDNKITGTGGRYAIRSLAPLPKAKADSKADGKNEIVFASATTDKFVILTAEQRSKYPHTLFAGATEACGGDRVIKFDMSDDLFGMIRHFFEHGKWPNPCERHITLFGKEFGFGDVLKYLNFTDEQIRSFKYEKDQEDDEVEIWYDVDALNIPIRRHQEWRLRSHNCTKADCGCQYLVAH